MIVRIEQKLNRKQKYENRRRNNDTHLAAVEELASMDLSEATLYSLLEHSMDRFAAVGERTRFTLQSFS